MTRRTALCHDKKCVFEKIQPLIGFKSACIEDDLLICETQLFPDVSIRGWKHFSVISRVFDHSVRRFGTFLPRDFSKIVTDRDYAVTSLQYFTLKSFKNMSHRTNIKLIKISQLLRQTAMHIVDVRKPMFPRESHSEESRLFVTMDNVVVKLLEHLHRSCVKRNVQKQLCD